MDTRNITIDEMGAADVPEASALWYSLPEPGVSHSFDTHGRIATCLGRSPPGFSTVARMNGRINVRP